MLRSKTHFPVIVFAFFHDICAGWSASARRSRQTIASSCAEHTHPRIQHRTPPLSVDPQIPRPSLCRSHGRIWVLLFEPRVFEYVVVVAENIFE